ncbi:neuropeptide FF receptor 2-like [Stylophora pistillata]|uniref:neuropeptide FF receptor 2-like n=1 Tax=Stylophora pistillata TaxID=50429 RepID=UPI000C050A7D|nr:neuropeptide FF receptor 2-like [Stylophora pistillata]
MDITSAPPGATSGSFETKPSSTGDTPPSYVSDCGNRASETMIPKEVRISFYCVVLLLSVLGNSLLIFIIKRNKRMQTVTNYLITNMAISDLLITVLAVPRKIIDVQFGLRGWFVDGTFGSFLCKSLSFFQDISTAVSTLSLVVIAIDRYRGIVFPLRKPLIKPAKLQKVIIPLIWLFSMSLHAPYFYIFRTNTINDKTYCVPRWGPRLDFKKSQKIYVMILLICTIAIPVCILISLYSVIIFNLRRNGSTCLESSNSMAARRLQEDKKVVRNIIAILIAFTVSITPFNVIVVMFHFVWDFKVPCGKEIYFFVAPSIFYLHSLVNPFIYYIFNDKYREGVLKIFRQDSHPSRGKQGKRKKKTPRNLVETSM